MEMFRKFQESRVDKEELKEALRKAIPHRLKLENVAFVCIGTDRSTGDSLGPLVGTYLQEMGYKVYGTLEEPVHAVNLKEKLASIPKDKKIIAVDSSLGQLLSVGKFYVKRGSIRPGAGVNKDLGEVGDYSLTGVVNVGGFMEYFVLQNTRLSLVVDMAKSIADAISNVLPSPIAVEVATTKESESHV
jgi:putative sporulation protein YyaC